jgi:hypothetical protein
MAHLRSLLIPVLALSLWGQGPKVVPPHFTECNWESSLQEVISDLKAKGCTEFKEEDFPKGMSIQQVYKYYGGWPRYTFKLKGFFGLDPLAAVVTFRDGKLWSYYVCWQVPNGSTTLYYEVLRDYFKKLYTGVSFQEMKTKNGYVSWYNLKKSIRKQEDQTFIEHVEPDTMRLFVNFGEGAINQRVYMECYVGKEKRPALNLLNVSGWFETPQILLDTNKQAKEEK